MAPSPSPSPSAVYFPALDRCLSGEKPLLSWESAYRTFALLGSDPSPSTLNAFLDDSTVLSVLSNPLDAFAAPSPHTKSDFETKTAAIHVLPSSNGHYDISQIKDDALWLSKEANIGQVDALRIVMLEWQNRAAAQLLSEWSEEERLSVQNVTADATFGASTQPILDQESQTTSSFDNQEQRRARLLLTRYTEATSLLALSASLLGHHLGQDFHPTVDANLSRPHLKRAAQHIWEAQRSDPDADGPSTFFAKCCDALRQRLTGLADPASWPRMYADNPELATLYAKFMSGQIVSILRMAFILTFRSPHITDAYSVSAWFNLMDQFLFLSELPPAADDPAVLLVVQSLVALISTSIIKIRDIIELLRTSASSTTTPSKEASSAGAKSYWSDDQCVRLITNTILGAVAQKIRHASLPILAWSIVCQALRDFHLAARSEGQLEDSSDNERPPTRSSMRGSRGPATNFSDRLALITDTVPGDDVIEIMGNSAVGELQAFDTMTSISEALLLTCPSSSDLHIVICAKLAIYSLIREGSPLFQYGPDLVQAVLSVISYDTLPPSLLHHRPHGPAQPVKAFLADTQVSRGRFLVQLLQRYAYELRPFLKCLLSISQSRASHSGGTSEALSILESMPTFTQLLPLGFEGYELVQEDEYNNCIQLTTDSPLFTFQGSKGYRALLSGTGDDGTTTGTLLHSVPAGTIGLVLSAGKPLVVRWQLQHSPLEYLGLLLSTRLSSTNTVDATTQLPVDKETAAEIIALADSLLRETLPSDDTSTAARVLTLLNDGLNPNQDIVRVVFDIFEEELQVQVDQPATEGSLYLLVHCARFLQSVMFVHPERIWSLLNRSKLLSNSDGSGALVAIVTASELPLGQYDFLRCCVGLYEALIHDGLARSVSRKSTSKTITRFEARSGPAASTPDKMMSTTLAALQRVMLDVLQSLPSWKFVFESERCEINTRILRAMNNVLRYAYGVDDQEAVSAKLTGVFAQAADVVLKAFLTENPHELTFHPILTVLMSAIADSDITSDISNEQRDRDQTISALSFCSTLLDVGQMTNRKIRYLATNLLQTMPLISRLFAARHHFKKHVATLMTSLVRNLGAGEGEPASLLGHLGSEAMKCFLAVIAELDSPVQDVDTEAAIWDMLSAVVSNKQQWLAVCLLTGSTPRDKLRDKTADSSPTKVRKPLFTHALDQLANINMLSPKRAIAILNFIARAQDHWSWATNGIGRHTEAINNMTSWIADLSLNTRPTDMEAVTRVANENQMAALIVDILARYLYNARQLGDTSTAKTVAAKLHYLRDNGVSVDGYNHSLHQNLAKNFTAKFPQCSLQGFKRTTICGVEFGRDYYYDCQIAGEMLGFDSSWGRRSGFHDEFARANVNLSLVESQVNLLKSWKALAIGLGQFLADNASLQNDLAIVASNCLKANMEALVPTALFSDIAQIRADLAFVLLQRLTVIKSSESRVKDLLAVAWDAVRTHGEDFATVSTLKEIDYYRTLLRVLFLAIQPQIYNPTPQAGPGKSTAGNKAESGSPSTIPTLLEILERVITVNFRALCGAVHEDVSSTEPADFVLLTALIQSILRVPGVTASHASVAAIFASAGTTRYAASLYSWADQLAAASQAGDPVHGELSVLFMLELSSVPLIAEQMAVDGVLSRISTANLSSYFRRPGGKGPFDEPARMFSIWSRGLVPLCLNLLEAVGPPIAAEVGAFLNSFPEQLKRAETGLENRQPTIRQPFAGSVTLGMAAETHSLSLISLIFERLKVVGPAAGLNADEVPSLLYDRAGAKEEVESMLSERRSLRDRVVPVGDREAEWAKQKPASASKGESRLEERVLAELEAAMVCLTG
ncbi:hypothetical protein AAFC00_005016 [Neodothiora populina]|uniref:Nucleoporin n=1 Tax=Neodothiora populina TaxID=2781224 RepID=A0ABR3P3Z2_9PEZI